MQMRSGGRENGHIFCSARYFRRLFALFSRFLSRAARRDWSLALDYNTGRIVLLAAAVFALCILSLTIDDILYNDRRLQTAAAKDMTTLGENSVRLQLQILIYIRSRGALFLFFFRKACFIYCVLSRDLIVRARDAVRTRKKLRDVD